MGRPTAGTRAAAGPQSGGTRKRRAPHKPTPAELKAIADRRAKALDLAAAGYTVREIAARLDYSKSQANRDVQEGLAEYGRQVTASAREELIGRELRLLDVLGRRGLANYLSTSDDKQAMVALRASERRCKLLGLDAPIAIEVSDEINAEIKRLATQLSDDGLWGGGGGDVAVPADAAG